MLCAIWRAGRLEGAALWQKQMPAAGARLYSNGKGRPSGTSRLNPRLSEAGGSKKQGYILPDLPGSELMFGLSPVAAAIQQGRRTIHGLYVQRESQGDIPRTRTNEILALASEHDIPVTTRYKDMMYRSVGGANHQGVIMKVSEYSAPRISELSPFVDGSYNITEKVLTTREPRRRFPFWVYCHDLQDSSNFGSIIRSAMFFGADAVLTPAQNVVKPTPLVSKASSGAMECMDIYRVSRHENFFAKVQKNGWLVVCATISSAGDTRMETIDSMPPLSAPTILVIGNERSGIPDSILEQSDLNVYISPRAELPNYIDSLNAGVAAGIILSSLKFKGE